jgi:hypothetical protein
MGRVPPISRSDEAQRALEAVSKAVREATWAFERGMLDVDVNDLPTRLIVKLNNSTLALTEALVEAERRLGR